MIDAIYFDMDGTIADLYAVENWLDKLRSEDVTPYREAKPLVNMGELATLCGQLIELGVTIGVISWLSKDSSKKYAQQVRAAKAQWLNKNMPFVSERHFIQYGRNKQTFASGKNSILFDDSETVRESWNGTSYDVENMLDILRDIVLQCTQETETRKANKQYHKSIYDTVDKTSCAYVLGLFDNADNLRYIKIGETGNMKSRIAQYFAGLDKQGYKMRVLRTYPANMDTRREYEHYIRMYLIRRGYDLVFNKMDYFHYAGQETIEELLQSCDDFVTTLDN